MMSMAQATDDRTKDGTAGDPAEVAERTVNAGEVEAVVLSADKPVSLKQIASALSAREGQEIDEPAIRAVIDELNEQYAETGRSFRIEQVSGGFRFMTLGEFAPVVAKFRRERAAAKLSRAAIETLAIVAYKQPITRAQLESIRGVSCGEVLRSLLERRLLTIKGRAEEPGRPILYGTTKQFLDTFGLGTIKDLPPVGELAPPD